MGGRPRLGLLSSSDGLSWEKVSTILEGEYTETALLFLPDDSLLAFTRQGPGPSISHARPPYTQWKVYEGPKMGRPDAVLVGNTILVTGRSYNYVYPDDQLIGTDPKKSIQRTASWRTWWAEVKVNPNGITAPSPGFPNPGSSLPFLMPTPIGVVENTLSGPLQDFDQTRHSLTKHSDHQSVL